MTKTYPRVESVPEINGFSIILSGANPVRSSVGRDPNLVTHYSRAGEVVRVDIANAPPDREIKVPEPIEENLYMSLTNAAERIGVHPSTLRRVAARGTLKTRRFGSDWATTPAWLDEYKRTRRSRGRPRKSA